MSYVSGTSVREAMSDRERYIRVAAIDIMIIAGTWNICIVERKALDSRKTSHIQ